MADEITVQASLTYDDGDCMPAAFQEPLARHDITNKRFVHNKMLVSTDEVVIPLGSVTAPGWAMFKNHATSGYIEIRAGSGGSDFTKILFGETAGPFRLGSDAQTPYAISSVAGGILEYLIIDT